MTEIVELIKDIGFPIAISVYLLVFQDRKLQSLETAINNNSNVLSRLLDRLGVDNDGE